MGSIVSRVRLAARVLRALAAAYDEIARKVAATPGLPVNDPSTPYWAIPPAQIACHGAEDPLPPTRKEDTDADSTYDDAGADMVIIGSGVTGTAVARTILDWDAQRVRNQGGVPIRVVMLEARDACSGATARNGGHITPPLYHDYISLKNRFGSATAGRIIRFRLAHIEEFLKVAEEEGLLLDSQARKVQTFDVFFDQKAFQEAKEKLAEYKKDMPKESIDYRVLDPTDGVDLVKAYQISPRAVGCISTVAGAIHPYRLVTGILSRLLSEYPDNFHLYTHTPCLSVATSRDKPFYTLTTPKGVIRTPHVVHATNGWVSHLIEPLRGKIIPLRGTMTAQRPGLNLGSPPSLHSPNDGSLCLSEPQAISNLGSNPFGDRWTGTRSFVFYSTSSSNVWDYLTQMPAPPSSSSHLPVVNQEHNLAHREISTSVIDANNDSDSASGSSDTATDQEQPSKSDWDAYHDSPSPTSHPNPRRLQDGYPLPDGELMFGGGLGHSENAFYDAVGSTDDRTFYLPTASYLSGALPLYFSGWGQEGREESQSQASSGGIEPGRIKSVWTGILGMSADFMPWVGRLPHKVAGRRLPAAVVNGSRNLAAPGEWIAAGYTGEGMVHAWMSAKAVAFMILNSDKEREKYDPLGRPIADKEDWLPEPYLVTEKRWKEADIDKLLEGLLD